MTRVLTLSILSCYLLLPSLARADDGTVPEKEGTHELAPQISTQEYEEQLQRERYKTALARERAEQAYQEDRLRHYQYQAAVRDSSAARIEQEREYDRQSNEINTISHAANTIGSIVRQAQVFSAWGW